MEKRTHNDADDVGPLGQHHQHHWGPVSPFQASRLRKSDKELLIGGVVVPGFMTALRKFLTGFMQIF